MTTRSNFFPGLSADPASYQRIEQLWHANIAKAVLESWELPDEVVAAARQHEDLQYAPAGEADLTDVLLIVKLLVEFCKNPQSIDLDLTGVTTATRLHLDTESYQRLLAESAAEIEALRLALGS